MKLMENFPFLVSSTVRKNCNANVNKSCDLLYAINAFFSNVQFFIPRKLPSYPLNLFACQQWI